MSKVLISQFTGAWDNPMLRDFAYSCAPPVV